jgi:hypothetical protein
MNWNVDLPGQFALQSRQGLLNWWKARKLRLLLCAFLALAIGGAWVAIEVRSHRFSAQKWKASSFAQTGGARRNPRRAMLKDLANHYLKKGDSRNSVLALLGLGELEPPKWDGPVWYYIGTDSSFGPSEPPDTYLVIEFSSQQTVKGWKLESPD